MTWLSLLTNRWAQLAIVGALAAFLGWRLLAAHETIGQTRGELAAAQEAAQKAVAEAEEANRAQTQKVEELAGRIAVMVEERRLDADRRAEEIAARDQALQAARRDADRLRRQVHEGWASSIDCQRLEAVRVDTVCPAVADRLRVLSRGGDED